MKGPKKISSPQSFLNKIPKNNWKLESHLLKIPSNFTTCSTNFLSIIMIISPQNLKNSWKSIRGTWFKLLNFSETLSAPLINKNKSSSGSCSLSQEHVVNSQCFIKSGPMENMKCAWKWRTASSPKPNKSPTKASRLNSSSSSIKRSIQFAKRSSHKGKRHCNTSNISMKS